MPGISKDTEQKSSLGRNINWYNYFGKLFGTIYEIAHIPHDNIFPPRETAQMSINSIMEK